MANAGKDDNGSQFFFTLSATPELQNKHTIFGKVTGETIYNMLKLEDTLVDEVLELDVNYFLIGNSITSSFINALIINILSE